MAILFLIFTLSPPRPVLATANIVINEFIPNPTSGSDWVELYNPTSSSIDISNWYLKDEAMTHIADFSLSTSISIGGYLAVDVGSRLNKENDTITLYNSTNETIDTYTYSQNPGDNISIGRFVDGETWNNLQNPTKGSSNNSGNPVPTPTSTIAPTPTPTSAPSSTPAPSITPIPTATPTTKPTATLTPSNSPTINQVLGENTTDSEINLETVDLTNSSSNSAEEMATPTLPPNNRGSSPLPTILMAIGGVLIAGFGSPLIIQELRARKNSKMNR